MKFLNLFLLATICGNLSFTIDAQTKEEVMPFLKGEYVYEYLRESKNKMGDNIISETISKTDYNDNGNIISMVITTNGEKTMETIDYQYGDREMSNVSNNYLNGQKISTSKTHNTYADDFYRNISVSEIESEQFGNTSNLRIEWTYDDQGRMTGMKQFLNGELLSESTDFVWTPNSCEYITYSYSPIQSVDKVSKKFQDENYVQNVLEIHNIDMNGVSMENKNECTYDNDGNLTSMKSYSNGQLTMEFKDYVWGDKKNTHEEVMYMNDKPYSISEVTQYYK